MSEYLLYIIAVTNTSYYFLPWQKGKLLKPNFKILCQYWFFSFIMIGLGYKLNNYIFKN
tara:strand:- start:23896 stop:24072 length:177 start_codon:yes stop_codon:yes gene_type:complete